MSNKVKVPGGAFYAGDGLTVDQTTRTVSAGGGSSVSTPDWNQNDATASDYIKNRPFYTGNPVETVLVEERTATFADEGGVYGAEVISTFLATVGETYKVSWDGTVYECVCVDYRAGLFALGNLSIASVGADTGEPFLIVPNGSSIFIYTPDTSDTHTFSISGLATEVVKIDEKYLPVSTDDSYGIIKKSDIVSAYNFPARVAHDQMVDAIAAFNTGNASIVWDGYKVINASYNSSNDTIAVKFADEPLEFLTYTNNNGLYVRTLGSPTYREVQGRQVRIVNENDKNVYTVLSAEGESSNVTLNVKAHRISILGLCGISETEMILKSSTSGSTKKFKITVDDSGTISATEVTA